MTFAQRLVACTRRLAKHWRTSRFILGLAVGAALVAAWVVGMYWPRAVMLGKMLTLVPAGVSLLLYPIFGAGLMVFIITSGLDRLIPGSFLLASTITAAAVVRCKLTSGDTSWTVTPFVLWSLLLFTWMVVSYLWSPYQYLYEYRPLLYSTILLVTIPVLIRTPRQFQMIVAAGGLGMVVTALSSAYGVYTLFSKGIALEAAGSLEGLQTARYYGHWEGPNNLGHAMMPMIVLVMPFIRNQASWVKRVFFFLLMSCGVMALMLSLSRAAILSLVLAVGLIIFHSRHRWKILAVSSLVILLALMILPVDLVGRISSISGHGHDASFEQRSEIYRSATHMIERSFPFGLGGGGFYFRLDDFNPTVTYKAGHAHNNILNMLVESGLIGLLLYIGTFVSPLVAIWRWRPRRETARDFVSHLRIALIAIWFGLLLGSMFEFTVGWPSPWLALLLMSLAPSVYSDTGFETKREFDFV